jgi:hypothetical protein
VLLVGVLLIGLAVAMRAIRARERRIGYALLGFCAVYLLAIAGLATGVAARPSRTRRASRSPPATARTSSPSTRRPPG